MFKTISQFLIFLTETDVKPLTIRTYASSLKTFMEWFEETNNNPFSLDEIMPVDVAAYKRYLIRQAKKPTTVNKHMTAIKAFCRWATDKGHIQDNPAAGVKALNLQRQAPKWLDSKEQHRLIRLAEKDGARNAAMVMLMMKAGLRVDEVCNLRLLDVVISDRKGTVTVAYGKGDKWRTVPLNNSARKALTKYLAHRESESPWLFVTQKANKMQPRTVQHIMAKYAKEIPGLTAHKLRHTFCHELVRAGVPLDQVAVLAGHMTANGRPNVNTTVIYTMPGECDLRDAVNKLDWE